MPDCDSFALQSPFTDAEIERAALHRTLNTLEEHGFVRSEWNTTGSGPARKVYSLTKCGEEHLRDWSHVLTKLSKSMVSFMRKVDSLNGGSEKAALKTKTRLREVTSPAVQPVS
jgi:DNA-binding PadR family transcriptional regulator